MINGLDNPDLIYPDQDLILMPWLGHLNRNCFYKVQPGDWLTSIAASMMSKLFDSLDFFWPSISHYNQLSRHNQNLDQILPESVFPIHFPHWTGLKSITHQPEIPISGQWIYNHVLRQYADSPKLYWHLVQMANVKVIPYPSMHALTKNQLEKILSHEIICPSIIGSPDDDPVIFEPTASSVSSSDDLINAIHDFRLFHDGCQTQADKPSHLDHVDVLSPWRTAPPISIPSSNDSSRRSSHYSLSPPAVERLNLFNEAGPSLRTSPLPDTSNFREPDV